MVVGCHFIATKLVTFGAEYIVTSNNSIAWDTQEMTLFSIVERHTWCTQKASKMNERTFVCVRVGSSVFKNSC